VGQPPVAQPSDASLSNCVVLPAMPSRAPLLVLSYALRTSAWRSTLRFPAQTHRLYSEGAAKRPPVAQFMGDAESFPPVDGARQQDGMPSYSEPRMPTDKQVTFAQRLAMQTSTPFPEEALSSFDAVSAFIDERLKEIPPSEKQVQYATSLAERANEPLDQGVLESAASVSAYISKMSGAVPRPAKAAAGNGQSAAAIHIDTSGGGQVPPTDKQLSFAITLARANGIGLSAEVLVNRRECSSFIDQWTNRSSGQAHEGVPTASAAQPAAAPHTSDQFYPDEPAQLSSAPLATPMSYGETAPFSRSAVPPKTSFKDEEIPF